jgi:hypothetical protein
MLMSMYNEDHHIAHPGEEKEEGNRQRPIRHCLVMYKQRVVPNM